MNNPFVMKAFLFPHQPRSPMSVSFSTYSSEINSHKGQTCSRKEAAQQQVYDGSGWMGDESSTLPTVSCCHWRLGVSRSMV